MISKIQSVILCGVVGLLVSCAQYGGPEQRGKSLTEGDSCPVPDASTNPTDYQCDSCCPEQQECEVCQEPQECETCEQCEVCEEPPVCEECEDCPVPPDCPDEGSDWVMLCHVPNGNAAKQHTIMVGASAKPAHLAHGDYGGPCVF